MIVVGILGCILPFLPGPPLVYASLLLLQLTPRPPFSMNFMIMWAAITILVALAEFYIPILGAKRFGGTKGGARGAAAGLLLGIFFPPFGMIIGPFLGAFIGEIICRQGVGCALRSAWGSFLGFVGGTVMKLGISIVMSYYFFKALI